MFQHLKCYGSTMIGEKGQVVIPAEVRKSFGIKPGDKFLVLAHEGRSSAPILLMRADALSKLVRSMFGDELSEILGQGQAAKRGKRANSRRAPRRKR